MPYVGGATGLILLGLWLFAIFDVIGTDESLCRNLPKGMWLILVVFLPAIGSISWLIMGRPEGASFQFGGSGGSREIPYRSAVRPRGIEDSPQYLARSEELDRRLEAWEAEQAALQKPPEGRDLTEWEAELTRREEELRRLETAAGETAAKTGTGSAHEVPPEHEAPPEPEPEDGPRDPDDKA